MIARTKLDNNEDIQDAISETVISIYSNLKYLNDIKKFNSWSTKILINNCNDIIRKKRFLDVSFEEIDAKNYVFSKSENYTNIEDEMSFFSVIKCLNEKEKNIVTMYYSSEYTSKEIALILDIKESTVRSILKRSREKIKENMKW